MELGDWWRVLARELFHGLVLGLILGILGYGVVLVFGRGAEIALAVSLAIAAAVVLANLLGSMLPFFFKRIGLDPAVTSGPFIASMMDVSAIVIYFSIAIAVMKAAG